jgi:hypothetical protein
MDQNNDITEASIIQRNTTKFLANKLGDEIVMMNMESGDFISMNNVGADIWGLSEQPISLGDLVQRLRLLYDIAEDQCMNETKQFLQVSIGQGIFTIHNTGIA